MISDTVSDKDIGLFARMPTPAFRAILRGLADYVKVSTAQTGDDDPFERGRQSGGRNEGAVRWPSITWREHHTEAVYLHGHRLAEAATLDAAPTG